MNWHADFWPCLFSNLPHPLSLCCKFGNNQSQVRKPTQKSLHEHCLEIIVGLRWPGDSQRESGRLVGIDSQKKPYFHNVRAIRANRLKPAIRDLILALPPPKRDSQKRGSVREP